MATKSQEILLKGNTTSASAVPSSLKVREIAINALDRSLFTNDGNNIVKLYTGTTKWFDVNGNANNALKLGGVLASEYIGKEAFNTHTNNTTIHITSTERTAWNNKWDYDEEIIKGVKVNAAVLSDKATKLATSRTLWGKPFDGSADVSGDLKDVGNITASGKATIQGDIISGGEVVAVAGEGTPAGVTDYSALTGKPAINGVTLVSGNNTLATLGIQAAGDYATNSGVATLLTDYATKTFVSNNYIGKSAFNNHTADTDIHVTSSDRMFWNSKWDFDAETIQAVKVNSASSADSVAWSGIKNKPSTFTPSAHTHTASDVSGLPTSLKNPFALTFGSKTYDGSAAATITASDLGALTSITKSMVEGVLTGNITSHTHSQYLTSALRPATFTTDNSHSNGYYKIRITNQVSSWMLSFDVKMVHYSSYTIRFSGSNYNMSESWFNPSASMIDGKDSIEVKFGYDPTPYLWVAIPASSRMGISITNVANGFIPLDTYALDKLFTITYEAELSGTTQQTITLYPPSKEGHTHTFASLTSKPNTINGYGITDALTTSNYNSYVPTLKGTGASGTWGISISGNAATATNAPWSGITGKPTTFTPSAHKHAASDITGLPTALKNPYAVEIKANGVSLGTYDGSETATFNLSANNVGAANRIHTHTASDVSGLPTKLSAFTNDVGYITGITKSMVEGVLTGNITSHTHTFTSLTSKPTTLSGYGITDAYTSSTIDSKLAGYLPLIGGTITGDIVFKGEAAHLIRNVAFSYTGGWAKSVVSMSVDNVIKFKIGALGSYTVGATDNSITYAYIGTGDYNGQNLRIYGTGTNDIKWGDNNLLHAGNFNSYAPTLTGTGASGTWGINISGNADSADYLTSDAGTSAIPIYFDGGIPVQCTPAVLFSSLTCNIAQRTLSITIAGKNRQVIVAYSTLSEKANKLATPRTIWGKSFDGTSDVNGDAHITGDLIVDGEVSALVS